MQLVLGSTSAGRQAVLKGAGFEFTVIGADIDEKAIRHDDPKKLVLALAHAKADAIIPRLTEPSLLITADQVVVCNGHILEKPQDKNEARKFLRGYRTHPMETVSSIVVTNTQTGYRAEGVDVARVFFTEIPDEAIEEAITQGDIMYCAGAMRCEAPPLNQYITHFEGTQDSTSGLPLTLLQQLMKQI